MPFLNTSIRQDIKALTTAVNSVNASNLTTADVDEIRTNASNNDTKISEILKEISDINFVLTPIGNTIAWVRNLAMATDTRDQLQHQQMNNQDYALGLKITALQTANTNNIINITTNTNNFNTQNTKITNLQNSDNTQNTKLLLLQNNDSTQNTKIDILEINDTNQNSLITTLQNNVTDNTNNITALQTNDTNQNLLITELKNSETSQNYKIGVLETNVEMNYRNNRTQETNITNNTNDILELNENKQDTITAANSLHLNMLRVGDITGFLSPGNLYVEKNIIAESIHANQHGITISSNNSANSLSILYSAIANGIDDPLLNIIPTAMTFLSGTFDNLNLLNVLAINNDSDRANRYIDIVTPTTIKNTLNVYELNLLKKNNPSIKLINIDDTGLMILNDQGGLEKIRLDNAFGNIEISGKLKGNIYENLVGGTNITLSELNGITTINSSASASSDGNVITSPPPLYAFSVTSNFNGNRVYNNAVLEFNTISYDGYFVKPSIDAYNFNTYQYTVPIDGVWNIGVRIYVQDGATANLRLGLYKNGTFLTLSGRYAGHAESIDILTELVKDDVLEVRTWSDTTNTIAMFPKFSYFYGHLVSNTGTSNAVSSETDLTVKSLNIGDVNIGEKILSLENTLTNSSDGNVITSPPPTYAFSVTSNFNGDRTYPQYTKLEFNSIASTGYFVTPDVGAYNFSTYQYQIPISGYWNIGVRVYAQNTATSDNRLAIYKDNVVIAIAGRYSGHSENIEILYEFVAGEKIDIRTFRNTNATFNMSPSYSYFYGHLVSNTGTSNAVSSETDLTVKSLNIGDVNIGEKLLSLENIISSNPTYAFSVTSSLEVPRTYNNSIVEFNTISAVGSFLTPTTAISAFNFSTYRYTIPVSGYWNIGARVYVQDPTTENRQVAIFKNGAWIAVSGRYSGHSESIETLYNFVQGDVIDVRAVSQATYYMGRGHSYFYGFLISSNCTALYEELQAEKAKTATLIHQLAVLTDRVDAMSYGYT